ncbi:MAG: methyltransferase domain-containing protein [Candidatus Kariarchaeaceae archaeon]|jgi:cyclopropane fatty-acyl-phospholipid synthase-like methyltransferase
MLNTKKHWNLTYQDKDVRKLGWYEENPEKSLKLISKANISKDEIIIDVGSGASTLIDSLIEEGYEQIIATDLSEVALEESKKRLGEKKSQRVTWIVDDIANAKEVTKLRNIALWHDRAVLHFLLDNSEVESYIQVLKKIVKIGGYVIIGVFSIDGVKKCSGLDVKNYDLKMLQDLLGIDFKLLDSFNYLYITPSGGERPYIYTLFQRTK